MSRSGTSATTRIVNLLGVALGADDELLAPVGRMNPKGFYENREIVLLNEELLERLGGRWLAPPALESGWEHDAELEDLRRRARDLLVRNFSNSSLWGFKDPRMCVLMPFWRDLIADASYVICHRNALEVARSLQSRDGLSLRAGIALWARNVTDAILNTSGARRIFVGYDELLSRRREVIRHLAGFLGAPDPANDAELMELIDEWLESDLRHHAAPLSDVMRHPAVSADARTVHALLELAIQSRDQEPGLRGQAIGGPTSDALDAAAAVAASPSSSNGQAIAPRAFAALGGKPHAPTDAISTLVDELSEDVGFLILGAAHARTMRLCELLRGHPGLVLPSPDEGDPLLARSGPGTPSGPGGNVDGALCGLVRPVYATGTPGARVDELAAAVAAHAPAAKMILLLRDPIERAVEHHRLAVARGFERRGLEQALSEQLAAAALTASRERPTYTNGYITWGEYGRIADTFLRHVPRGQLLILLESELESEPLAELRRVLRFLDVDDSCGSEEAGGVPPDGDERTAEHFHGAEELMTTLRRHFASDAQVLERATGTHPPWAEYDDSPARTAPALAEPETSIVVLHHGNLEQTSRCARSVVASTTGRYELLLLLDNGSEPGAAGLERLSVEVGGRIVVAPHARGAAATPSTSLNAALDDARSDEIALLSAESIVTNEWLPNLRQALRSSPDIAAVGPRSNYAQFKQGGIWLDDTSSAGIARFARSFNHHDRARWFEVERLDPFAILASRAALERVFDESGGSERRESRLWSGFRRAQFRLLCAGDTFIYHAAHAPLADTSVTEASPHRVRAAPPTTILVKDLRLVVDERGRSFEVADGIAYRILGSGAGALIRSARAPEPLSGRELDQLTVGPPTYLVREEGTERVWLVRHGRRRCLVGDAERIRRLAGITLASPAHLGTLPQADDLAVELSLAAVPETLALLSIKPAEITDERLAGLDALTAGIGAALEDGRGYALIRLGTRETLRLNAGAWPVPGVARPPGTPAPRELRQAILDADAVGVPTDRSSFASAPLLERVLFHLDLYPPVVFDSLLAYALLGFDPETGKQTDAGPLRDLLADRPIAVVGWLAEPAARLGRLVGLDVRVAVALARPSQLEEAFLALAAERGAYDAVLVAAGLPAKLLAPRLARELDVVALDVGHALDRLLYPRHHIATAVELEARWAVERYLRQSHEPPPDIPHEWDGRLVRATSATELFYIERGRPRKLSHRALTSLFDNDPLEVEPEQLARLPAGLPISAVHGGGSTAYALIDGRKVRIQLGMPLTPVDSVMLRNVPEADRRLRWLPGPTPARPTGSTA